MTTTAGKPQLDELLMVIDGSPRAARSGRTYTSTDPYTGQPWAQVPDADARDVDAAVAAARAALGGPWGKLTATQRGKLLHRLGELIARDAKRLAVLETRDNGKLLREMGDQMAYLPEWYYYYAGLADKVQGDVIPSDKPNYLVYTRHEPVGVVAAIVPWNSPLLLLTWKLAPALAAGCTIVVKPSDYTPVSTLAFAGTGRRGRLPARRGQRGDRLGPRGGQVAGRPSRHRQDRVHRVDAGRQAHRQGGRGQPHPGDPRARRQVRPGRVPRRGSRRRGQRRHRRGLRRHRADLHGGLAGDRRTPTSRTRWSSAS